MSDRGRQQVVTVSPSANEASAVLFADMVAGVVHVAGITASATVAVYGSPDGVAFGPVYGSDGTPATLAIPAAGGAVVMPDTVRPLRFVKLVSGTDLGTAASVVISLKS